MENTRYNELVLRYGALREACADLLERQNHLEQVEGPELSSRYMMEIGQYEMRVFELTIEIRRWKRRFELRQQALNFGREPDFVEIEAALDAEFERFREQLKSFTVDLDKATLRLHANKLTDKQSTEVRCLYLNAAKRLHPDTNPSVTENMKNLWTRIQIAYAARDWSGLRFLCGLVDTIATDVGFFSDTPNGISDLEREISRLERVVEEQREVINDMNEREPWSFSAQLSDVEYVKSRQAELKEEIDVLLTRISKCENQWQEEVMA